MEISAVMNVQEMAVNKAVLKRTDDQARQDKINQLAIKETNQEEKVEKKAPLETYPAAFAVTAQNQDDPKASSMRIERQVDVQASKQAIPEGQGNYHKTGSLVDVFS